MYPDEYLEDIYNEEKEQKYNDWVDKYVINCQHDDDEFMWLQNFKYDKRFGWYKGDLFVKVYFDDVYEFIKYFKYGCEAVDIKECLEGKYEKDQNMIMCYDGVGFIFNKEHYQDDIEKLEKVIPKDKYTIKEITQYDEFIYERS